MSPLSSLPFADPGAYRCGQRRALPGVYFDTRPAPVGEELPPMDVAAFVGFAAAGPVGLPVAVEDMAAYRDIFGADPELGFEPRSGAVERGLLGATVDAFFRGGGRRCHVLRVADSESGHRHHFAMASLSLWRGGSLPWQLEVPRLEARSLGSWCEGLRAGAALERSRVGVPGGASVVVVGVGELGLDIAVPPGAVVRGDLLELVAGIDGPRLYAFIDDISPAPTGLAVRASWVRWLEPVSSAPGSGSPPDLSDPAQTSAGVGPELLRPLDEAEGLARWQAWLAGNDSGSGEGSSGGLAVHHLALELLAYEVGSTGELSERPWRRLGGLGWSADHPRFWGDLPTDEELFAPSVGRLLALRPRVEALHADAANPRFPFAASGDLAAPDDSEGASDSRLLPLAQVGGGLMAVLAERPAPIPTFGADNAAGSRLERDGLGALIEDAAGQVHSASLFVDSDLAMHGVGAMLGAAEHKLYLRSQPLGGLHALLPVVEASLLAIPDAVHRGVSTALAPAPPVLLAPALGTPAGPDRFARLSFSWSAVQGAESYGLEVSIAPAMGGSLCPTKGSEELSEPPFGAGSFKAIYRGEELQVWVPIRSLIAEGDDCPRRLRARVRAWRGGERGPASETREIFVPWPTFRACGSLALGLSELTVLPSSGSASPPDARVDRIVWTPVIGAMGYELQIAPEPSFVTPRSFFPGSSIPGSSIPGSSIPGSSIPGSDSPSTTTSLELLAPRDTTRYLRVRALGPDPQGDGDSDRPAVGGDRLGPWSRVWVREAAGGSRYILLEEGQGVHGPLLAVQRAGLRFCASRRDLVALLSFPRSFEEEDIRRHLGRLAPSVADPLPAGPQPAGPRPSALTGNGSGGDVVGSGLEGSSRVPPLTLGESSVLGFGAAYHPWLGVSSVDFEAVGTSISTAMDLGGAASESTRQPSTRQPSTPAQSGTAPSSLSQAPSNGRSGEGGLRLIPPEGAMAGLIARLSRSRGAWWAPANQPLDGVLAAQPRFDRFAWARLAALDVNLVRPHPRGFLPLGASTLAPSADLRPLNVRRLMILLRRLALREGASHVFEPSSHAFRDGVRRRFEGFLGELHRRGAFGPERAADAFRVVTDSSVNPPSELDRGRFVVELRVAPSRPLVFLTLRLVQTGPQLVGFEGPEMGEGGPRIESSQAGPNLGQAPGTGVGSAGPGAGGGA